MLLGEEVLERLRSKRVAIVGLGGVGAYAAEMLARAGVGSMVIVDNDIINPSNKNRQLLALDSTMGMAKCNVMAKRLLDINPQIELKIINKFLTEDNVSDMLSEKSIDLDRPLDYIVDAIDTLSPKIALIQYAIASDIPIVSSMGAGAKLDATKIRIADISKSFNCPLAYMLRKRLRKVGINKGFKVVFSEELPDERAIMAVQEQNKKSIVGTISYLPAVFGSVCAQVVVQHFVG